MGVLLESWQMNVERFLMILSVGLDLTGEVGAEQKAMKEETEWANRRWRSRFSSN